MLTGLLLQAPARPSFYPHLYMSSSPNGRYTVHASEYGIALWKDDHQIWAHATESGSDPAVSDQGELVVCLIDNNWVLFDASGQRLAVIENSPLDLETDPPRTCWSHRGSHYIELSQGDIYVATQNRWQKVANPPGVPAEVRRHQRAPLSEHDLSLFLNERSADHPPNFRHLSAAQKERLIDCLRSGQRRAALVLGLARCQQARAELLKAAGDYEEAQLAIILLDGPQAAPELLPALKGYPNSSLLRLYEQVPCPQAVPLLLQHLNEYNQSTHAALVAQTRVDLGRNPADWREWLSHKNKARLGQFKEPSAPLWKAQQDTPDLRATLLQQPALLARFDLASGGPEQIVFSGNRLVRRGGDAHARTLEWSLVDGKPLVTMPAGFTESAKFRWNSQRQLLYYYSRNGRGLWQSQQRVFSELTVPGSFDPILAPSTPRAPEGKRPSWLPPELDSPEFAPDGSYVQSQNGETILRISLVDGTRQTLKAKAPGLNSPDGRFWFGPQMLMDVKRSLIYRTDLYLESTCFSPDSQTLAGATYREVALLEAKNLRLIRMFSIPNESVHQLAFDETGRRLAVVSDRSISVYGLTPEPPDLSGDTRLATECWTGYRLSAGAARKLTEAEYWERRRRLAQQQQTASNPYLPIAAGFFGIGLLTLGYLITRK